MRALERLGNAGLDVAQFRRQSLGMLRSLISVDAAFFATVDPATLLFTGALAEEPLAAATSLFLHNEFGLDDVNKFAHLAACNRRCGHARPRHPRRSDHQRPLPRSAATPRPWR